MLENAREVFASSLGVRGDEVTFTPSGTHAVHLGVLGLLAGRARTSKILARSAVEHSSVVHACDWHAARGGEVVELPVDITGRVTLDPPDRELAATAVQAANRAVGTVQPVAAVAALGAVPLLDRKSGV